MSFYNKYLLEIGFIISIVILGILEYLTYLQPSNCSLDLDNKWLIISFFPTVLAILKGGYIQRFKGFGFELEANFNEPAFSIITKVDNIKFQKITDIYKTSSSILDELNCICKYNIKKLILIEGNKTYEKEDILKYLKELPKLKYFEIQHEDGTFVALVPTSIFECTEQSITIFIDILSKKQIREYYKNNIYTLTSNKNISIIDTLKLMKEHNTKKVIILDNKQNSLGIIELKKIKIKISEEIISKIQMK